MSVLAVEDCLISKLPLLFTSSSVAEMSDEMLYLLAGENEEISAERKRQELKQGILEKGLQDLKSLYKHSTVAGRREYHGLLPEDIEKVSAITQSKSEKGSSTTDRGTAASEVFVEEVPISQKKRPELQADHIKWPDQDDTKDFWSLSATRKVVKHTSDDDHRWDF